MPQTDLQAATLCAATYAYKGDAPVVWDHEDLGEDDGVHWAFKKFDGFDTITMRGTVGIEEWLKDACAITIETPIGEVHAGFDIGMEKMADEAAKLISQPLFVNGHSLGAAHADLACAYLMRLGITPARRVAFGEPRPGLQSFCDLIKDVPAGSFCNGDGRQHHDVITDVPFDLRQFRALDYRRPTPLINVVALPTPAMYRAWTFCAFHHIFLYRQALGGPPPPPDSIGD